MQQVIIFFILVFDQVHDFCLYFKAPLTAQAVLREKNRIALLIAIITIAQRTLVALWICANFVKYIRNIHSAAIRMKVVFGVGVAVKKLNKIDTAKNSSFNNYVSVCV